MNATVYWRIVWKEYRAQRAFWISMAVVTLVVELALLTDSWIREPERIQTKFFAALAVAALYALGSGATLFAAERETETYDFLRALPARPMLIFAGKLTFALASTVALFGLTWTLALALARGLPNSQFHSEIWILCGVAGAELIAWGILFSLLLKRPLVAAIYAGTVTATVFLGFMMSEHVNPIPNTMFGRLLVVALVMLADVALATRWFRETWFSPARSRNGRFSEEQIEAIFNLVLPVRSQSGGARNLSGSVFDVSPSTRKMLGRLVWQDLRQSMAITAALIAMLLPTTLFLWAKWVFGIAPEFGFKHWWFDVMSLLVIIGYLSPALLGSSIFLGDQVGCHFRFLAERGIPPRLVWLSRQIRGLVVMLVGLLLILPPMIGLTVTQVPADRVLIEYLLKFVVMAYPCGQLCSMACRSGISAVAFGCVLTFLLCGWEAAMAWLGLSWLWSVAPIPLAFLAATWLHAPNWFLERKTWRAWLQPALIIAIPALAILAAIPPVRVYEIPLVGPGFDAAELTMPTSAEEKETVALYKQAIDLMLRADQTGKTAAGESERRKSEEQAVKLALEATRRTLPSPYSFDLFQGNDLDAEKCLADLIFASGKRLQSKGEFDAALDRYLAADQIALLLGQHYLRLRDSCRLETGICEQLMHWAAESGQKPQRILEALRTLEKHWRNKPSYCDEIKHHYLLSLRILEGDRAALKELPNGTDELFYLAARDWLPWERARAMRLLNELTSEQIKWCRDTEETLATGGAVVRQLSINSSLKRYIDAQDDSVMRIMADRPLDDWLKVETYRRATRLIMALEAWKLEHGGLPNSLDDLVGKYCVELPIDPTRPTPTSGRSFGYESRGLPCRLEWHSPNSTDTATIEPGQSLIYCGSVTGRRMGQSVPRGPLPPGSENWPGPPDESTVNDSSKTEVWNDVWVFPIP